MSKSSGLDFAMTSGFARFFPEFVRIDTMREGLHATVRIDCIWDTQRIQQLFIRALHRCQARGDHRFDELEFRADGFWLAIKRQGAPTRRQCRMEIYTPEGDHHFVYTLDFDLDGPDDQAAWDARQSEHPSLRHLPTE